MPRWIKMKALFCAMVCAASASGVSQNASNYAVQVSASVQTVPPQITLSWPADASATNYSVFRKGRDDTSWGAKIYLGGNATNYVDTNVSAGSTYEYGINKIAPSYQGFGYIYAGIEAPLVEKRGIVILIVDNTYATNLSTELSQLEQDLIGDGWTVWRHDVPRMSINPADTSSTNWFARASELANVHGLINADYASDPTNVQAVFLFGHVPVPYSGVVGPDGHFDHFGAWPADTYYGDMVVSHWTDASANSLSAADSRNWNQIGDGKFDQGFLPGRLQLEVGRVDFANMSEFPLPEVELLRQYLKKDHAFRTKQFSAQASAIIDDNFGLQNGEAFAADGWRNFAPIVGPTNTFSGFWPPNGIFLWGYGCGPGNYDSAQGVITDTFLATNDTSIVFTMLFGSYFGDWDAPNDLLRAQLAAPHYTLTSVWAGRPYWVFHHMALGETVGFSARVSENNNGLYAANLFVNSTYLGLMGDPTLRMHVIAPPAALSITTNVSGGVNLSWSPSTDVVAGYHVYSASTLLGPFTRLNSSIVTNTSFSDPAGTTNVYMVRAVNLQCTPSGSYWNMSEGAFGTPTLMVAAQSTTKIFGASLPLLNALYLGFTNGDTPASLASLPVLSTPVTANTPPGTYPIFVTAVMDTNYTFSLVAGTLTVLPASTVCQITVSTNPILPSTPLTFSASINVQSPGQGVPTGTMQFTIDGENAGNPLPLSDSLTVHTNLMVSHGSHLVQALYSGDINFLSASNQTGLNLIVNIPPVTHPVSFHSDPLRGAQFPVSAILNKATDADGDTISLFNLGGTSIHFGSVSMGSDGVITYTPALGYTNDDQFNYNITDGLSSPVSGTVYLTTQIPPQLTLSFAGSNGFILNGQGIQGQTYRIQSTTNLAAPNWQLMGSVSSDASGAFQLKDTNSPSQTLFYRAIFP